ncbi:hypothetical protein [Konateibacter massiliensis]|uniref:hypothetical protein n=1 Tax=Konateibacter massiliensis TaxID=2002841 RepID=UPI00117BCDB9|nr:hypothetical protein [Konateibacter massiliensis]
MKRVEIIFDVLYLLVVFIAAGVLYRHAEKGSLLFQYAVMAFVLGAGDSCHLIPRIYTMTDKGARDHTVSLGIGKFITSITMTLFYLILWEIGKKYYGFEVGRYLDAFAYGCAFVRILLCLFLQNGWTSKTPSLKWGIYRNIPFVLLGAVVMLLYIVGAVTRGGSLSFMWLAILVSFVCYIPVVLFSGVNPKIGMLMLPKSCAYAAIVLMGFSLI